MRSVSSILFILDCASPRDDFRSRFLSVIVKWVFFTSALEVPRIFIDVTGVSSSFVMAGALSSIPSLDFDGPAS